MSDKLQPWKTLSRETILDYNNYLTVEEHTIELPDGRVIEHWPWIVTPDFVIVVAITTGGEYICFRQTKYSVDSTSLAPTGGYVEPEEDPLDAAKRELLEETGYQATKWIDLGAYVVDANRGMATAYLYLARDVRQVAAPNSDDLEDQQLLLLSRDETETALLRGEFKVLPWAAAVALALLHTAES